MPSSSRFRGAPRPAAPRAGGRLPALALTATVWLGACSPTLDWRELRPEGWAMQAVLPCRPDRAERTVSLAGAAVRMTLWACDHDGSTFALASAELSDPGQVAPALRALAEGARANVQGRVESSRPAQVTGMTPQPAALRLRLQGQRQDARAVTMELATFSHGLRVFQATVIGAELGPALTGPFFDGLRLLAPNGPGAAVGASGAGR